MGESSDTEVQVSGVEENYGRYEPVDRQQKPLLTL